MMTELANDRAGDSVAVPAVHRFEEVETVFADPLRLTYPNESHSDTEER